MQFPKHLLNPQTYTKPRIFLCQTDKERLCELYTSDTKASLKFNAYSELSFEVGRIYNDVLTGQTMPNPFYDFIESPRLIFIEGFGYFEIQNVEIVSDGIKEAKQIESNSLEYTLSTKYLEDFYINQGTVESLEVLNADDIDNIVPITLYNPSMPHLSLMHLVLEKIYGWSIGHVDDQLKAMSRQFEIDRMSVYDFIMNEVCDKFNCYMSFDTINNIINIYAQYPTAKFTADGNTNVFEIGDVNNTPFGTIETVSIDGYKTTRWSYEIVNNVGILTLDDIPQEGASVEVVGVDSAWETDVFVSFDNLIQEANVSYNADDIKTVLTVTYGDDGDIRDANLGLPYLTDISYFHTVEWMGQDLYDAYNLYVEKSNSFQTEYNNNAREIFAWNDRISYEENRLSLEYSVVSVGPTTVGTYYVRHVDLNGGFYYSAVSLPADYKVDTTYYSNLTANVDETKVKNLYSALKIYSRGYFTKNPELKEEAFTEIAQLEGFDFLDNYTLSDMIKDLKKAASEDDIENAVNTLLAELWKELGRTPLQKLYLDPYQTTKEANADAGWSTKDHENYGSYYITIIFIDSINVAIAERDKTIEEYKQEQVVYQDKNAEISNQLLMDNNFTNEQLVRLSAFLREDELHLDDFVETELDDLSSSMALKQDAKESGRIELKKLCQPQLKFSMDMANIYALYEFAPIVHQFQLGNIIRVGIRPDYIKQSRLMQVDVNFDDFSDFSCEFGELTNLRTQSDIHANLLSNAISAGKSVATYSGYWSKGSNTATQVDNLIKRGLLNSTTVIKAIDGNQGVTIDKYGIHLTKVDHTTGAVDPKQGWIINNQFLFSDDGFRSSKAVFGEYAFNGTTYYGVLAEALVGELIIGSELKIGNNSGTLIFDDKGLNISNDTNSFKVNPNNDNLFIIEKDDEKLLYLDQRGDLNITGIINATGGNIGGCEITDGLLKIKNANISEKLTANQINVDDVISVGTNTITKITNDAISTTNVLAENLKVKAAHIDGKVVADQIDATKLRVNVANIDGELIANSIEVKDKQHNILLLAKDNEVSLAGWTASANSLMAKDFSVMLCNDDFGLLTSIAGSEDKSDWRIMAGGSSAVDYTFGIDANGSVYASSVNLTGVINATGGNIGGCTFDDTGKLIVDVAHISGKLTADKIDVANLSVDAANVTGVLSVKTSGGTPLLTAGNGHVKIGGWNVDANSLYSTYEDDPSRAFICTGTLSEYKIGGYTDKWYFGAGSSDGYGFGVSTSGVLCASGAKVSGEIIAKSGDIGGWAIETNGIVKYTDTDNVVAGIFAEWEYGKYPIGDAEPNDLTIVVGQNFGVSPDGSLYANKAHISGGEIGGWNISESSLVSENRNTWIMPNGTFTFMPNKNDSNNDMWCGFVQNGSGGYNFVLGSDCIFQFGDKAIRKADFEALLSLIGAQRTNIEQGDIYE